MTETTTRRRISIELCTNTEIKKHAAGKLATCGTCQRRNARAEYAARTGLPPETMCRNWKYQHTKGTSPTCKSCVIGDTRAERNRYDRQRRKAAKARDRALRDQQKRQHEREATEHAPSA